MGIDLPDEGYAADGKRVREGGVGYTADVLHEARDRAAYHAEYRATVEAAYRAHWAAHGSWDAELPRLRQAWAELEMENPLSERSQDSTEPDTTDTTDTPGAWHGDGGRYLAPETNAEVDRGCERIRDIGENIIAPGMRDIEAEDPDRHLIGFKHRLKGTDRLKEKVAEELEARPGLTSEQALSLVPDAVRFTFCYTDEHYAAGVSADLERLSARGFEPVKPPKNSWSSDQYKGINAQWR